MDPGHAASPQAAALEHKRASELEALQKVTEFAIRVLAKRGISPWIRDDQGHGNCTVCTAEFGKFLDSLIRHVGN
jgi:hypothetical protein